MKLKSKDGLIGEACATDRQTEYLQQTRCRRINGKVTKSFEIIPSGTPFEYLDEIGIHHHELGRWRWYQFGEFTLLQSCVADMRFARFGTVTIKPLQDNTTTLFFRIMDFEVGNVMKLRFERYNSFINTSWKHLEIQTDSII